MNVMQVTGHSRALAAETSCSRLVRTSRATALRTVRPSKFARATSQITRQVAALEEVDTATSSDDGLDKESAYKQFESLLEQYSFNHKTGDKVTGTIFRVDAKGAYVDIGGKAAAYLPSKEISSVNIDRASQHLRVDTVRDFVVVKRERNGELILSLKRIEQAVAWQRMRQYMEEDVKVFGEVVGTNRGGVMVDVNGIRGFVPASQLAKRVMELEELMGDTLPLKPIEVDEEQQRLLLSNRRAGGEERVSSFKVGDVVEGIVQAVKPYGAFIDIGGINGLLHISQISHDRISSVEQVLSEGDKLKVMVLSQDRDKGRVALSTKKLEPSPGDMVRDPKTVYERADEMAALFRERVAQAEAAARAEVL